MDTAERQSVRHALDRLKPYLEAFLAQHRVQVEPAMAGPRRSAADIQALLKACVASWDAVLSRHLPRVARSYIHELLDVRNRWAHEAPFSAAEAARAADTAQHLGVLIGLPAHDPTSPPRPTPEASQPSKRRPSQRDVMTRIFASVGRDEERAILEYAAAERRGEVSRKSNKHGVDPEAYARALLNDGLKKGWLTSA